MSNETDSRPPIVALLDDLELTQSGFARAIDVTPRSVRRWCSGDLETPRSVVKLLHAVAWIHRYYQSKRPLSGRLTPIDILNGIDGIDGIDGKANRKSP